MRFVLVAGLFLAIGSFLYSDGRAAATPGDSLPQECLGPLRSALVRSGLTFSVSDEETGEPLFFGHFNGDFNPGDYRGTAGWQEFLDLLAFLERTECLLPVPTVGSCIDFDASTECHPGDSDGDEYLDFVEERAGSDAHDPASTPEFALLDEQSGARACSDRLDNDLDGHTDKGDEGCRLTCKDFGGKQRCSDVDHDGWLNYVEIDRGSDPNNSLSTPEDLGILESCGDGIDNDLDGRVDGDDFGCGGPCIDFSGTTECPPF